MEQKGHSVTKNIEETIYENQSEFIRQRWGQEAADKANYGWSVDEVTGEVATKVYGHGVVVTSFEKPELHGFTKYD